MLFCMPSNFSLNVVYQFAQDIQISLLLLFALKGALFITTFMHYYVSMYTS